MPLTPEQHAQWREMYDRAEEAYDAAMDRAATNPTSSAASRLALPEFLAMNELLDLRKRWGQLPDTAQGVIADELARAVAKFSRYWADSEAEIDSEAARVPVRRIELSEEDARC